MFDPTKSGEFEFRGRARTLTAMAEVARWDHAVRRCDVGFGDRVVVHTRNSVYSMISLGDGTFSVRGGWFDSQNLSGTTVAVNGCTYGGSAIRHDVIAARGLFLEFGNNVLTTRILDVRLFKNSEPSAVN